MQKGEQIDNASALVQEAPALKRPCFPKPKAAPEPSSAVGSGWARGFLLRRLNASALAGDSETFSNDIQRLENLSEKEASTLLHKARCGWLWLWEPSKGHFGICEAPNTYVCSRSIFMHVQQESGGSEFSSMDRIGH